jgi:lipopolysaccharide export system ATP-binding protein
MPIHARARLGLSYLPQEASIFRKLTVAENVRAILELQDLDADVLANRLDALLEDRSISYLADAPALSLSGGERRRVEIARALATRPRRILRDEPFAGIDPIAVLDIQKIIGSEGTRDVVTDHKCARRWASATARTSSTRGASWLPAPPARLFIMRR